jgi:hypothetical protein
MLSLIDDADHQSKQIYRLGDDELQMFADFWVDNK